MRTVWLVVELVSLSEDMAGEWAFSARGTAVWDSTANSEDFPIVVYFNGAQANDKYADSLGILLKAGTNSFSLYASPGMDPFERDPVNNTLKATYSGTAYLGFDDGTTLTVYIPRKTIFK